MNLKKALLAGGVSALLCMAGGNVIAQGNGGGGGFGGGGGGFGGGRGNFDPAQMQQRMLDNIREQMDVKSDDEWKVIETRVQKVMDARREAGPAGGMGRMFRGRRGGNNADANGGGPGGGRRGGMFGQPMPELTALENAIENNAPTEQIKAALDKYRAARKVKEAALEQAQADLQKVLTVKQEAVAVTLGLLN